MATRIYAFAAAIAALLTSGLLYHVLAGDSAQLDAAAARVAEVPMIVGDWQAQQGEPTDDAAFAQTGAKGYWMRHYLNQKTKTSVLVILMCGRPGKMAVHTPEVCYSGAGYAMQNQPGVLAIREGDAFWTARFAKKAGQLQLCWAWNADGNWEASTAPRWQFRGEPFLYKLYVSREMTTPQTDATAEFLHLFVPELSRTLFPL